MSRTLGCFSSIIAKLTNYFSMLWLVPKYLHINQDEQIPNAAKIPGIWFDFVGPCCWDRRATFFLFFYQ